MSNTEPGSKPAATPKTKPSVEPETELADQARQLVDLARRAFTRRRALFILVQYNHEADKLAFLGQIKTRLGALQISTHNYDPLNNSDHGPTKLYPLLRQDAAAGALSLVLSMPRQPEESAQTASPKTGRDTQAADFLSYINLYRDSIARDKLHWILFLRDSEMATFIKAAGDLWSFRHRTFRLERELDNAPMQPWLPVAQWQGELRLTDAQQQQIKVHIHSSRQLVGESADKEDKAQLWLDLTRWLDRHYVPLKAIEAAMEGIALLQGDKCQLLGTLENTLGDLLHHTGNYPEALNHYKNAQHISRQLNDPELEGSSLSNIAQTYHATGDYGIALDKYQQSLTIAQIIGDKSGESARLNHIAEIYHAKGDGDTALHYLQQALAIARDIKDKIKEGAILNNLANICHIKRNYDAMLTHLQEALTIAQENGDKGGESSILNNRGVAYHAKGDSDAALNAWLQALDIRQQIGNKAGEGITLNNIAQIYAAKGDDNTALGYLQQTRILQEDIGDQAGLCATLFNIAHIHWRNNEAEKAKSLWLKVYQIAQSIGLAEALDALTTVAEGIGLPSGPDGWAQLSRTWENDPGDC